MEIIGVTGGIGSGKSVVCRFLRILGYSVYDSDERGEVVDGFICIYKVGTCCGVWSRCVHCDWGFGSP